MEFHYQEQGNGFITELIYAQQKTSMSVLNNTVNEGLRSLLAAIIKNPGVQAKDLPALLENRPLKTIERQIRELVIQHLIQRRGSRKTGGYWAVKKDIK